ncbi:Calx-beta domain-containing protein [Granulosicoccaceae sp. 1_MG-2023]|nr:Calx-beta domain-containing protein [Granulosicoccaceae sp. 1_MG-2023]
MANNLTRQGLICALVILLLCLWTGAPAEAGVRFNGAASDTLQAGEDGSLSTSFSFDVSNDIEGAYQLDFIVNGSAPDGAQKNQFREQGDNCNSERCSYNDGESGRVTLTWLGYPREGVTELEFVFTYCEIPYYLRGSGNKALAPRMSGTCPAGSSKTVSERVRVLQAVSSGTVSFVNSEYRVSEDAGSVTLEAERSGGSDGALSVKVRYEGESATAGEDYREGPATLSWKDGEDGIKSFTVPIESDRIAESDESFLVDLVGESTSQARVTIVDVAAQTGELNFTETAIAVTEGDEAVLRVERSGGSDGAASLEWRSGGGDEDSAEPGDDYTESRGTLSWKNGEDGQREIRIPVKEDAVREADEAFSVRLRNIQGARAGGDVDALVTIRDNTRFAELAFRNARLGAAEDQGSIRVEVLRSGSGAGAVSVRYRTGAADDTATEGEDYRAVSGTLEWAAGDTAGKSFEVPLLTDALAEGDETLSLILDQPAGNAELGDPARAILTISDATAFGTVSFASDSYQAGEDAGQVNLTLQRKGGTDGNISVRIQSQDDSAEAGSDFTAVDQVVSWQSGDAADKTVAVTLLEDTRVEDDERFSLRLSEATGGARIGSPAEAEFIIDNTTIAVAGSIGFSAAAGTVKETDGSVSIVVQRSGGSDGAVSVDYRIGAAGDTASAGEDYTAAALSGQLRWDDQDQSERTIALTVLADDVPDNGETLSLSLLNPAGGATLAAASTYSLSIVDNTQLDVSPDIGIVSGDGQHGFPGTVTEPFIVELSDADEASAGVVVNWTVEPAAAGRLLGGNSTRSDDEGRSRNELEILAAGTITVTATVSQGETALRADPNQVRFTVNAGFQGSAGLTPSQRSVGKSLDSACATLDQRSNLSVAQQDLLATCDVLAAGSDADIRSGIARLTPEEAHAIGTASIDTADIQVTNVQSRLNTIRMGNAGLDLSSLNINLYGQSLPSVLTSAAAQALSGGAGGDDLTESRLGVFVNGSMAFGSLEEGDDERGLDFDTRGLTLGIDYRSGDEWVVGVALGLIDHDGDFTSEGGSLAMSGTSVSAFATWYQQERAYIDMIADFGQHSFDLRRRVNLPGGADQFAVSSADADALSLSLGGGLDYHRARWQFGPYGRLSYIRSSLGAYNESASDSSAAGTGALLHYDSRTLSMSTLVLGGQVSRNIPTARGVWIPQLRLELEHRLDDGKREIDAAFLVDPELTGFTIESEDADSDYLNLGLGFSVVMQNGKSAYLYYESRLGQARLTQHWIKGGVRLSF